MKMKNIYIVSILIFIVFQISASTLYEKADKLKNGGYYYIFETTDKAYKYLLKIKKNSTDLNFTIYPGKNTGQIRTFEYVIIEFEGNYFTNSLQVLPEDICKNLFLNADSSIEYFITNNKEKEFFYQGYYKTGKINNLSNDILTSLSEAKQKRQFINFDLIGHRFVKNMTVLGFNSNGDALQLNFIIFPEFFTGEHKILEDLYEEDIMDNYSIMALSFLSTFFEPGDSDFLEAAGISQSELLTIKSSDEDLKKVQNKFKDAFMSHMSVLYEDNEKNSTAIETPYINPEKIYISSLYNDSEIEETSGNLYIDTYLKYCFKKNKPVTSLLLTNTLKQQDVEYNYSNFSQISEEEGNQLADAALKYLTWGVETCTNLYRNYYNNFIFESNKDLVSSWVKPGSGTDKSVDYLPSEYSVNTISDTEISTYSKNKLKEFYDLGVQFTTPFSKNSKGKYSGNPVPYAPYGIDSPRIFNYKMYKQCIARNYIKYGSNTKKYKYSTYAYKNNYYTRESNVLKKSGLSLTYKIENRKSISYLYKYPSDFVKPVDNNNQVLKPFLPGYICWWNKDHCYIRSDEYYSYYEPCKAAGVDSIGLLQGSLVMSGLNSSFEDIFNQYDLNDLEDYYKMPVTGDVKGLDDNGEPVFYNSESIIDYRTSKTDIEKNSVIIADLKELRPGDLIACYDVKNEPQPHIGIVVKTLWTDAELPGLTALEIMEKTIVVSVSKAQKYVRIDYWKAPSGKTTSFTKNPFSYHARRLLKKTGNNSGYHALDSWDFFSDKIQNAFVDVKLPDDKHNEDLKDHWIPNTAEFLDNIKFKFTVYKDKKGKSVLTEIDEHDVSILPPLDCFFNQYNSRELLMSNRNIFINKGKGIELWANGGQQLVARFLRINTEDLEEWKISSNDYYYIDNDSEAAVDEYGKVRSGFKLYIEDDYLTLKNDDFETSNFSIKVYDDGNILHIRPGDDFLLRFDLGVYGKVTAKETDFVAVYDKKMLWRANLYIDERKYIDGGDKTGNEFNDWNDAYKWNINDAESIHYNKWNREVSDWAAIGSYENEIDFPPEGQYSNGDGGQVVELMPWTSMLSTDSNKNVALTRYDSADSGAVKTSDPSIYNSVSYSWGCNDSPFSFNWKMQKQLEAMKEVIGSKYDSLAPDVIEHEYGYKTPENGFNSNSINNKWVNYVFGEQVQSDPILYAKLMPGNHGESGYYFIEKYKNQVYDIIKNTSINDDWSDDYKSAVTEMKKRNMLGSKYFAYEKEDQNGDTIPYYYKQIRFNKISVGNKELEPYTPGLTSVLAHHHIPTFYNDVIIRKPDTNQGDVSYDEYIFKINFNKQGDGDYFWQQACYSAGIDCSGLVIQSASWVPIKPIDDNNYIDNRFYDYPVLFRTAVWDRYSDAIFGNKISSGEHTGICTVLIEDPLNQSSAWLFTDLKAVIPGDIVVKPGHIAIVHSVKYKNDNTENNRRIVDPDNSLIIEAAGSPYRRVVRHRTLSDYVNESKRYCIKRLKVKSTGDWTRTEDNYFLTYENIKVPLVITYEERKQYSQAISHLEQTHTGREILKKIRNYKGDDSIPVKLSFNNQGINMFYKYADRIEIQWDPASALITKESMEVISAATLLGHEFGHVIQAVNGEEQNEENNLRDHEKPIAKYHGEGVRQYYKDWVFNVRTEGVISLKPLSVISVNDDYKYDTENQNKVRDEACEKFNLDPVPGITVSDN